MMEGLVALFVAPLVLFVIFVAPIWVILHYRSKNKINAGLNDEEAANIRELAQRAQSMQERIRTLEAILDEGHAGWRRQEGGQQ
ncbi:envelope stress response membrane protein PspB [Aliidiomarina minuta]|uniref:Envelope stress response membrane protein PspB n=1 Tax=Aliidiomarina minuta TaxID=880057 RepID=A0A432WAN8_9GAMM|nr:envelope stress response membrane protein PspB [Aliidiomarina minuta]RUO27095.1 envelope stress response membrane protein PspB [Aliidiomarina minuta]